MVEIFADIPEHIKELAKNWVDLALRQKSPIDAIKMITEFANSCNTEEEKEFIDFYFRLRLEQLQNESDTDLG